MPPSPPLGWSQLKTTYSTKSKGEACPKLFYNYFASSRDGITLLLTDLISLWCSSASVLAVLDYAAEQHSSIDPSESTEQLKVLLEKLRLGLDAGKTQIAGAEEKLLLKTNIDLPKPLRRLEWTFTLRRCEADELADQLLRPTLHQLSVSQQRLQSLFDVLKQKDHVIQKLLDRVADKGIDMSLIFPGLTGTAKRGGSGVKVEDARKVVPGITAFDRDKWEKSLPYGVGPGAEGASTMGLEELVKGCETCFAHSEDEHAKSMGGWVQKLPGPESLEGGLSKSQSQSQSQPNRDEDTESENEFETQQLPSTVSRKRPSPADEEAGNSTDEAEQRAAKKVKTGSGKLGVLGKRKQTAKPVDSSSPPPVPVVQISSTPGKKSDASTAAETASESDFEDDTRPAKSSPAQSKPTRLGDLKKSSKKLSPRAKASSPPAPPVIPSSAALTPSRRLGRIGKARERTSTASPIPEAEERAHQSQQSQVPTPTRKLGRLGMRNKAKQPSQFEKNDSPPATTAKTESAAKGGREVNGSKVVDACDSDATASASPSPSLSTTSKKKPSSERSSPTTSKSKSNAINSLKPATRNQHSRSKSPTPKPKPELELSPEPKPKPDSKTEPETEEQKTTKRREQLKKTIQGGGKKNKKKF